MKIIFFLLVLVSLASAQSTTPVFRGGTGAITLSGLLYGNGTSPITGIANGTNGYVLTISGGIPTWQPASGSGTVTSVALSLPNIFSVSGSPVTTSGTLSATLASQLQNLVFASPNGSSGTPSFRSLTLNDIPFFPDSTGFTDSVLYVKPGGGFGWKSAGGGGSSFTWIDTTNENWIAPPLIRGIMTGTTANTRVGVGALDSIVIGEDAENGYNTAVGFNSLHNLKDGYGDNTAVGVNTLFNLIGDGGRGNVAIGNDVLYTLYTGSHNTAVGSGAGNIADTAAINSCILLGYNAGLNAPANMSNTFVAGSDEPILDVYFGSGVRANPSATPGTDYTIHGSGSCLAGLNIAGGAITLAGGISTGSGAGGDIIFKSSPPGSTGTSDNALAELFRIKSTGDLQIAGSSGTPGQVLTSGGGGFAPSWYSLASSDVGLGNVTNNLQLTVANNLSDLNSASTARTNLGLGSSATHASTDYLLVASNLSDVANATTARGNLSGAKSGANTDISSVLLGQTGLVVMGGDANALTLKPNETMTAARTLNLKVNDASRTIDLSGNLTVSSSATISGTNTGDQTITLTGDVTGSGTSSFAATIGNDKVTTAKILDANVTLAKIANADANSKLLGSGAAGSGAPYAELTLGTGLSMSGTTLNASSSGMTNPMTTTGDIIYSSDNSGTPARLAVGSTGKFLGTAGTTPAWKTLAGTTNQITVSNSSGDLTLSTPQDIHTSATPQFARLGLGQAADATSVLAGLQAIASNTIADGFLLANSNAATAANQIYSPAIHLTGYGWGTTAGTSQSTDWRMFVLPTQSTVPTSSLYFASSIAGASYTFPVILSSAGTLTVANSSIAATRTDGLIVQNVISSTVGVPQQFSPSLVFSGTAYNSTSGLSQLDKWEVHNEPQTVAGTTTANLLFQKSINGGSYSEIFGITSAGDLRLSGSAITTSGILNIANGGTGNSTYTNGQLLIGNTSGNTLTKATLTGTANEVVVTNGNGTITLSTPQDIATASTPQFLRLGLNQSADATASLALTQTALATTSTDGLILQNTTVATSGATIQYSPRLVFSGTGYNSTSGLSETDKFMIEAEPTTAAGATNTILFFKSSLNGAAYSNKMQLSAGGTLSIAGLATGVVTSNSGSLSGNTLAAASILFGAGTTSITGNSTNLTYSLAAGLLVKSGTGGGSQNTVLNVATIDNGYSAQATAAGFGTGILLRGFSTTTGSRDMGSINAVWSTATDASRTAYLQFMGVNNAASNAEWMRLANGLLTIGVAGTLSGTIALTNATGSNAVTLAVPATPSAYTLTLPVNGGTVGQFARTDGSGGMTWKNNASSQSSPATPTGTVSAVGVMMGLAGSITPNTSGQVLIMVSGDIANSNALGGCKVQLRYGTGTAPTNGAASTGTALGGNVTLTSAIGANDAFPFSVQGVVTGLTVSTAYWIDIQVTAITAGTATPADISISAHEF